MTPRAGHEGPTWAPHALPQHAQHTRIQQLLNQLLVSLNVRTWQSFGVTRSSHALTLSMPRSSTACASNAHAYRSLQPCVRTCLASPLTHQQKLTELSQHRTHDQDFNRLCRTVVNTVACPYCLIYKADVARLKNSQALSRAWASSAGEWPPARECAVCRLPTHLQPLQKRRSRRCNKLHRCATCWDITLGATELCLETKATPMPAAASKLLRGMPKGTAAKISCPWVHQLPMGTSEAAPGQAISCGVSDCRILRQG